MPQQDTGAPARHQGGRPGEEKSIPRLRNRGLESVHSAYLKEVTRKDKELMDSWTEILNIILTFGGLLSAVITAFLLAVQPDLKLETDQLTNQILLHILKHLNNSSLPTDIKTVQTPPPSTFRCLAYWHTSLGCSLMSTFGALLCKLCVIHYQSSPRWADTEVKKIRLRDGRFAGLERWHMHSFVGVLPVVLQAAVFLFYLGLAESPQSTSSTFIISIAFASILGAFFALTILAGTLFPFCPYKSTISLAIAKAVDDLLFWSWGSVVLVVAMAYFLSKARTDSESPWMQATRFWRQRVDRRAHSKRTGEEHLAVGEDVEFSQGVCWWHLPQDVWDDLPEHEWDDVVGNAMRAPPDVALSWLRTKSEMRSFVGWSLRVFPRLRSPSPSKLDQVQANMVCYFMYHSHEASASVKVAIQNSKHNMYETAYVYICKAIRHGFVNEGSIQWTPLPIAIMPPTTLSVYLRYQLLDWGQNETQWNVSLLLQELPIALKPDYFEDLNVYLTSLVDAISLAAIALVPRSSYPEVHSASSMANSNVMEQLLQAIHRLSYLPVDVADQNTRQRTIQEDEATQKEETESRLRLAVLVIIGVKRIFGKVFGGPWEVHLCNSSSWKDGSFVDSLSRLIKLGHTWWHDEPYVSDPRLPGGNLVHELHALILRFPRGRPDSRFLVGMRSKASAQHTSPGENPEETAILSPDLVVQTFASYSHPSGPRGVSDPHSLRASDALDYILGLRSYRVTSHLLTPFLPGRLPGIALSRGPAHPLGFTPPAYLTRQLIHDMNNSYGYKDLRRLSLSIIVKSQDIFISQGNPLSRSPLETTLKSLLDNMIHSENVLDTLSVQAYEQFTLWSELIAVLEHRDGSSIQDDRGNGWHRQRRVTD